MKQVAKLLRAIALLILAMCVGYCTLIAQHLESTAPVEARVEGTLLVVEIDTTRMQANQTLVLHVFKPTGTGGQFRTTGNLRQVSIVDGQARFDLEAMFEELELEPGVYWFNLESSTDPYSSMLLEYTL